MKFVIFPALSFASSSRDFDPRTRAFSDEELKPQPMVKKSRKQVRHEVRKHFKYTLASENAYTPRFRTNKMNYTNFSFANVRNAIIKSNAFVFLNLTLHNNKSIRNFL